MNSRSPARPPLVPLAVMATVVVWSWISWVLVTIHAVVLLVSAFHI